MYLYWHNINTYYTINSKTIKFGEGKMRFFLLFILMLPFSLFAETQCDKKYVSITSDDENITFSLQKLDMESLYLYLYISNGKPLKSQSLLIPDDSIEDIIFLEPINNELIFYIFINTNGISVQEFDGKVTIKSKCDFKK